MTTIPKRLWYFGLEPVASRYTAQLSGDKLTVGWMPHALHDVIREGVLPTQFMRLQPSAGSAPPDIIVGRVLDATGRGTYAMEQCNYFLDALRGGLVSSGDVLFLQDFWTPGLEAIRYALDLYDIDVRIYSMLHAQSVDEYDFTAPMQPWMRPIELGYDAMHSGIFVASSVHRDQLRAAGFKAPIHVVGLPIDMRDVLQQMQRLSGASHRGNQVIYTSRLDTEKQPGFMLAVAKEFLLRHPDWTWLVTSSRQGPPTGNAAADIEAMVQYAAEEPRFQIRTGLSKDGYYTALLESAIQFNCSLQDYVSWTLLEASLAGCELCYPNFRSFPECVPAQRLYEPFSVASALALLTTLVGRSARETWLSIAANCDYGRKMAAKIALLGSDVEANLWQ